MPFITQFNGKQPSSNGPSRRVESGAVDNARKSLVHVLEERFETIPAAVMETLAAIEDPQRLTTLMRAAVKVPSMKDFLVLLNG